MRTPFMTKSLTSLWLKNLRRVGKVQQAKSRKLFQSLLAPAAVVPPKKRPKVAKVTQPTRLRKTAVRLKSTPPSALKARRKPAAAPARAAVSAPAWPGSWKKSFFTLPGAGLAPARRMQYWLYLPASAALAKAPLPLVVMLHGCQQMASDFATSTRMNQLAERKGFAVLYPQQSALTDAHHCWHWYKRATQKGQGDVELIAQMIQQLQARHAFDATRIYVAGLSAGAGIAAILALRHPGLIAAAGLHSAPVYGTAESALSGFQAMQRGASLTHLEVMREFSSQPVPFPGMPVILIQGQSDPVVRRVNADQLAAQFAFVDAPFITSSAPVLHHYPGRSGGRRPRHAYSTSTYYAGRRPELMQCEVEHLGHAWSGGHASVAFSAPEGPDATLLMWTFFARQRRQPPVLAAVQAVAVKFKPKRPEIE